MFLCLFSILSGIVDRLLLLCLSLSLSLFSGSLLSCLFCLFALLLLFSLTLSLFLGLLLSFFLSLLLGFLLSFLPSLLFSLLLGYLLRTLLVYIGQVLYSCSKEIVIIVIIIIKSYNDSPAAACLFLSGRMLNRSPFASLPPLGDLTLFTFAFLSVTHSSVSSSSAFSSSSVRTILLPPVDLTVPSVPAPT